MNQPLISIITLNYNQTDTTCAFLESTKKLTYKNYEILVCDMASEKDPTEQISAGNFPNTKVLVSKANLGFSGGNNWGMRQAHGDFIFIVNNDTEVTPGLLEALLLPFEEDKTIGAVSPKIRFFSQPNVIQYAGFEPMNFLTGRVFAVGNHEEDTGQHDISGYTNSAHGCAMMVKKEVIEKVGMFPENFFLYYEEWDWSARMQRAGYHVYYESKALVFHKESMSVGKKSKLKLYYLTRNRILFLRRNSKNKFQLIAFYIFFTLFSIPKSLIVYTLKGRFSYAGTFTKAVIWNLKNSSHSRV